MGFSSEGATEASNRFGDDLHAGCHWLMMRGHMGSVPKRLKREHQSLGQTYIGSLVRFDGHRHTVDKFDEQHALIRLVNHSIERTRWQHISDSRIEWLTVCHNSPVVKNPVTSWRRKVAQVKFRKDNLEADIVKKLTPQNAISTLIYHGNPGMQNDVWYLWRAIVCLTQEHRHEPSGNRPPSWKNNGLFHVYRTQLMSYLHAVSEVYGISPDSFNDLFFNEGEDELLKKYPEDIAPKIKDIITIWQNPEPTMKKKIRQWSKACLPLVLFECDHIDAENIHVSVIFHDMTFVQPKNSTGHVQKQFQRLFFRIYSNTVPSLYTAGPMDAWFCQHVLRSSRKVATSTQTASSFVSELMPYQRKCLGWLIHKETHAPNGVWGWTKHTISDGFTYWTSVFGQLSLTAPNSTVRGGLLAQEVGMGKTVELLALIASRNVNGPTLVVVPTTMLTVWMVEAAKHTPSLKVLKFHGARRPKDMRILAEYDIVLTTYKIVVSETNQHVPTIGAVRWGRIVLDESHEMKTIRTATSKAICKLYAPYRWCCSATPWPKDMESVTSMLAFLGVSPFDQAPSQGQFSTAAFTLSSQHPLTPSLMYSCLTKLTFWQKKNHVKMPLTKIREQEITCDNAWPKLYKHLIEMVSKRIQDDTASVGKQTRLLHYRRWLRHAATHPSLNKLFNYGKLSNNQIFTAETGVEQFLSHLGTTSYDKSLRDIVDSWRRGEEKCSICMDVMDRPTLTPCHHMFCYECIQTAYQHDHTKKCPLCRMPADRNLQELVIDEQIKEEKQVLYLSDLQGKTVELSKQLHDAIVESKHVPGGKFQKLIDIIMNSDEKFIVFTQFHNTWKLACDILRRSNIIYASIDGSMSPAKRYKKIKGFQEQSDVKVFVMTTKTASVGITLTAASQVIFMEPIDSEDVKRQAVGRAWRIGQTKPVTVTTLKTQGTIDCSQYKDITQYIQNI